MVPVISDERLGAVKTLAHGFFTREGGAGRDLNTGLGAGDDTAIVMKNRALCLETLGLAPASLATVYQVHSATVVEIDGPDPADPAQRPRADAMVTDRPGLALGILTADCAPVLFADPDAGIIGAAHAGWRGALTGVIEETVAAMKKRGAKTQTITAAIGPCIGRSSYEVGPEFPAPFLGEDPGADRFFIPAGREAHYLFDLAGYVRMRLARAGIATGAVPFDTCREETRFFSYRRATLNGEADYGRQISLIAMRG